MSQMPDKIWLHKDTKYSTADTVYGYQYDFVQGIEDEGGIENFVEYVPKNMFIDKACEWLSRHFYDKEYEIRDDEGIWIDADALIEGLKKAIMEDKK